MADPAKKPARKRATRTTLEPEAAPARAVPATQSLRGRIGIGAARLRGRVSEASNMELAPAELTDILAMAPDELVHCPQSGAILVRVSDEA